MEKKRENYEKACKKEVKNESFYVFGQFEKRLFEFEHMDLKLVNLKEDKNRDINQFQHHLENKSFDIKLAQK